MFISREDKRVLEQEIIIKLDPCLHRTESDIHLILKVLSQYECKAKKRDILFKMKNVCLRLLNQ